MLVSLQMVNTLVTLVYAFNLISVYVVSFRDAALSEVFFLFL